MGAERGRPTMQAGMRAWLRRHAYSFFSSIGTIVRQPVVNLMTITVLAIALSLPLGLYTALENVRELSRNWERLDSISVFLHQELHEQDARRLASRVSNWADVLSVDPVSPTAGLRELAGQTGLDASSMAMDWLDETDEGLNPLPWTLEVSPLNEVNVAELAERIRSEEGVDSVIVDLAWLQRLDALINVFARLVQLLSLLFGAAVLFVIANNVRADIQTRQEEIEVMALVGATAAYVRRPFLYSGLWMGLLGSLLAWGVVMAGLYLLQSPMQALAMTYGSPANLQPPSGMVIVGMVTLSGVLGIVGAVIAVSRQLSLIKP